MKPLKLTMRALVLMSLRGTIDFERNGAKSVFESPVDTGAGKTTILMPFVLHCIGEASSGMNKKNGNELQSQYADPPDFTFVGTDFSEGDGISGRFIPCGVPHGISGR